DGDGPMQDQRNGRISAAGFGQGGLSCRDGTAPRLGGTATKVHARLHRRRLRRQKRFRDLETAMTYRAPVRDIAFPLDAVAGIGQVAATGAFPDYDADVASAVLDAAAQFSEEVLAPLNRPGDLAGAKYANGAVTAAPGFADAYQQFAAGGWTSLTASVEAGGQALPKALELAAYE